MEIKAVIFDFGDVIGHFDIEHFNKFVSLNRGRPSKVKSFFKEYKSEFDKNRINEKEFWTKLSEVTKLNIDWHVIARNNQKNLMIDYYMINIINEIKITKILLSNMDVTTAKQIRSELEVDSLFDDVIFSCDIEKNKLDFEILNKICNKHKINPEEVLFIDDYEGNISKAKDYGFKTILFKDSKELKERLNKEFGLLR